MRNLLPFLLLLASCGGGSGGNDPGPPGLDLGPPPSGVVYVQAVPPGTWSDGRLGEYDQVGADGFVRIRSDILGTDVARRILRHEFGHALGLPHAADVSCVMHVDAFQSPTLTLCGAETAHAASFAGTLTVYVGLDAGLLSAVGAAADEWNAANPGTILAVQ